MSSFWRSAADSSLCTYRGNIRYTSGDPDCPHTWYIPSISSSTLSTTSHSLKCRPLGVPLYTPMICVKFHLIFSRCLQYASVLQTRIIFQAINWLIYFYIPEQKGPLSVISVIKHTFTTTQNTKLLHIYARQLLTVSCGITARQYIIYYSVCFPSGT